MSLFSPGPHYVDVLLTDDRATGPRGFRSTDRATVRTAVNCWVQEQPLGRNGAFGRSAAHGREEERHIYQVLFGANPALTNAHVLVWTPPGEATALYLRVKGVTRPQSTVMPYIAYCEAWENAEGAA